MDDKFIITNVPLEQIKHMIKDSAEKAIESALKTDYKKTELPEYVGRKQTAKFLNIKEAALDYIVKDGRLKKYKQGTKVLFKREDILNFYKPC